MATPLLSEKTERELVQFASKTSHALLILAPQGAGKGTVARFLASRLLDVAAERLDNSADFRSVQAPPGKALSIEEIREITHFLLLKAAKRGATNRVVVIEHAGDMTTQAQNALLKTIEEPPAGTVLILTAAHELDVLPTIRSRVQIINLQLPSNEALKNHFAGLDYKETAIDRALLMSAGLPGMTKALLVGDQDHPLVAASNRARTLLQQTTFERLVSFDELVKSKQEFLDTLFIVGRMAEINLSKSSSSAVVRKWRGILAVAHEAHGQVLSSAQIKLVGLNFILNL